MDLIEIRSRFIEHIILNHLKVITTGFLSEHEPCAIFFRITAGTLVIHFHFHHFSAGRFLTEECNGLKFTLAEMEIEGMSKGHVREKQDGQ